MFCSYQCILYTSNSIKWLCDKNRILIRFLITIIKDTKYNTINNIKKNILFINS